MWIRRAARGASVIEPNAAIFAADSIAVSLHMPRELGRGKHRRRRGQMSTDTGSDQFESTRQRSQVNQ
jgi:hypothetical protein